METPSFEPPEPSGDYEEADEEAFQDYVENLQLHPEDFEKKILDIGAGSAKFAKWAKEHGVSSHIYSAEIRPGVMQERTKGVVADGAHLPFADGAFDMVVSSYSMPHLASHRKDLALTKKMIGNIFSEMLRVTSSKGEIRLVGVPIEGAPGFRGNVRQSFRGHVRQTIKDELEILKAQPGITVDLTRGTDSYRYEKDGVTKTDELLETSYLVVIRKNPEKEVI